MIELVCHLFCKYNCRLHVRKQGRKIIFIQGQFQKSWLNFPQYPVYSHGIVTDQNE